MTDSIVVGGGQSGLAAAYALRQSGLEPLVLEAAGEPVGSWPRYYDSLTLFSPAGYSSLPGKRFPGDPARYPYRDEVTAYLREYAAWLDADIRTGRRVTSVREDDGEFVVLVGEEEFRAPILIAASGGFGRPHRPVLPGSFSGDILHAAEYREPSSFAGQRVLIIGSGNSGVQIGKELAERADVTLVEPQTRVVRPAAPARP